MDEKQFELSGVTFGRGADIEVSNWSPGSPTIRTQDTDRPTGDGVRMGRDFRSGATWSFSMFTNADSEEAAWDSLSDLSSAWEADDVRSQSDAVLPLRYRLAGRDRRVYGRPRRWTASPTNLSLDGRIDVEADFALVYPLVFDDHLNSQRFTVVPPLDPQAGFLAPFTPPFTLGANSSSRQFTLNVGGKVPTPIMLTFEGPLQPGARVEVGDWVAQLEEAVPVDDPVTVDARPWVRTVTRRSDGSGVRVAPRLTRLSKMWLAPGSHKVTFSADSPSGTGSVVISWHDAFSSPR